MRHPRLSGAGRCMPPVPRELAHPVCRPKSDAGLARYWKRFQRASPRRGGDLLARSSSHKSGCPLSLLQRDKARRGVPRAASLSPNDHHPPPRWTLPGIFSSRCRRSTRERQSVSAPHCAAARALTRAARSRTRATELNGSVTSRPVAPPVPARVARVHPGYPALLSTDVSPEKRRYRLRAPPPPACRGLRAGSKLERGAGTPAPAALA
jgi:hypothetical protein